ncbi:MAG: hypothetical protein ACKVP0_19650 [Pirellulaceae bacterium]
MKSAGRHHKPVNNELANWLGEHIEQWKPHLPLIGGIAVIVLVGFVIYLFATSGTDSASAPAWQEYYAAFGEPKVEDALKNVAEKQEKTLAGRWARLTLADQQLRQVTQQLVQSPKEGKATLEKAVKNLTEAADGASDKALLTRVNMSLGKASETANKLDDARKYYELVAKGDPEGTFGKSAVKALKRLDKGSDVPELLAWLDKQELESRPKPTGSPFDMGQRREPLPERPDLSIPGEMKLDGPSPLGPNPLGPSPLDGLNLKGLPGAEKPKTETPKSTEPAKETPKTTTPAVPTPVKPAVPTPVKPAEKPEEKAAEEKPSAEVKKSEGK